MRARDQGGDVGPELAAELLSRGHEVTLRARGVSMSPLVRDGDLLQLAPLDRPPCVGDLVAALSSGRLLVHRVVQIREGEAELRGDALWIADGWFVCQQFVSKQLVCKSIDHSLTGPRLIGVAIGIRRDGRSLGCWRLSGLIARSWLAVSPLVRLWRGAWRRTAVLAMRNR